MSQITRVVFAKVRSKEEQKEHFDLHSKYKECLKMESIMT